VHAVLELSRPFFVAAAVSFASYKELMPPIFLLYASCPPYPALSFSSWLVVHSPGKEVAAVHVVYHSG
jgi:hypothetical protein